MSYLDAHYALMRLAEDLDEPRYRLYLDAFLDHQPKYQQIPEGALAQHLTNTLERAETFTMSPNMAMLVRATAAEMPSEPLRPEDLPSQDGFLWLSEPFEELDIRGRLLRHHAVMWSARGSDVLVQWFADRADNMDEINVLLRREGLNNAGRFMLAESTGLKFGENLPLTPNTSGIRRLRDYDVLPTYWEVAYDVNYETVTDDDGNARINYVPVPAGDERGYRGPTLTEQQFALIQDAYADLSSTEQVTPGLQQLVCFWRLCQQTLSAREHVHPNRTLRKQLIRRKIVPKAVTVITLRRRKHPDQGTHEIEWDHRWLRRGHWRQQWFGPRNGERYQRAIYINPTICGPEDKPLIIRPHVNVLAR